MKLTTIVLVTNNYTPYCGGVVSSLQTQVAILQQLGYFVYVIAPAFLINHLDDPEWVIRISCRFRFLYKQNHMAVPIFAKRQLYRIFTKIKPDIVHVHHPFLLGPAAVKIANKLKIPVCFTYHTMYHEYLHYVPIPEFISKPIISKLVKSFCKTVNHIIAPSNFVKRYVEQQGTSNAVTVICSALQKPFLGNYKQKQIRAKNGRFTILVVSRLVKEKNIRLALDMFAYLYNNLRFELIIIGYGALYQDLQEYAYQTKKFSKNRIRFIYKPDKQTIAQWYQRSDVLLFTSTTDTQGLVLAESLSAGTPVVTVSGPGQQDTIIEGYNGFFVKSAQHMASKILELADSPKKHSQMQQNSVTSVRQFLPEVMGQKLQKLYQKLLHF